MSLTVDVGGNGHSNKRLHVENTTDGSGEVECSIAYRSSGLEEVYFWLNRRSALKLIEHLNKTFKLGDYDENVLKDALQALEHHVAQTRPIEATQRVITAIREHLGEV